MRNLLVLISCLIVLTLLIIYASNINSNKYYLEEKDGALEIRQGKFAPMGTKRLMTLPGVAVPETLKSAYTWTEICPMVFRYYLNKADTISEVPGVPDFDGIKSYLNKALTYAVTEDQRNTALSRLYGIDIMILLYKADVNVSKGTLADLNAALSHLKQADSLDLNNRYGPIIHQKIESIQTLITSKADAD